MFSRSSSNIPVLLDFWVASRGWHGGHQLLAVGLCHIAGSYLYRSGLGLYPPHSNLIRTSTGVIPLTMLILFYVLYALTSPYVGYNGKERQYTQYQGSG